MEMKKIILFIAMCISPALAQTSFTIPAPDGKTITSTSNVWSCVQQNGLPPGMTFDGTTLTVPALSATKLTLTGGTAYSAGLYLISFDSSGNLTYSPYVAPSGGAIPAQAIGTSSHSIASAAVVTETHSVTSAVVGQSVAVINPTTNPGNQFHWDAWVSATNQITIRIQNVSAATATYPATTYTTKIF